ncbi:MAG: outer membrane protein assembly factor BamA, partial [Verrucomicrobia bacterium]|nr:outer membrane protein assembly factor BamA [Cytophagales bacterium]
DRINIPSIATSTAIKKIYDLGIFADIEIIADRAEGEKIFLEIAVKERPRLSDFVFKGVKKGEAESVKEKVKFIRGQIVNDSRIKNLQLTIRKHFVEKGYFNVAVNIKPQGDSLRANSVKLLIDIDKNQKVKINDIIVKGNKDFAEKKVLKRLKDTKEKKFTRIFKPSKYIATKYEEDKQKLIKFYNAQGYRDARILRDTVYRYDDRTINLEIDLEEGRKYFFRSVTWEGNYIYDDKALGNILDIKRGDVYDIDELSKRLNYSPNRLDITSLYMNDGYLAFQIEPVEVAVEGDSIDVEMRITEGKQFEISSVNVSGNTKTSDHVVIRELLTVPGQKFSRQDIIQTQQRLSSLGYFNPEKIDIQPVPNIQNGTVDINYTVEERPSDQIELSGGWGGYFGFVGTLGLTFNNFSARKIFDRQAWRPLPSGDGQKLSLRFQANGRSFQTYSISFSEPWLGGRKPNSLSVSLSHTVQRPNAISSRFQNFNFGNPAQLSSDAMIQISGVNVGLGRRLNKPDSYFSLSNALAYQIYSFKEYGRQWGFNFDTGTSHSVAFITTLSRFSLDNQIFPRTGSSLTLTASLTPPWSLLRKKTAEGVDVAQNQSGLIEYHKWMFDGSWFSTVVGKLVLHARSHFGFLGRYNSELAFSPFERFSLGGSGLAGQNFALGQEIIALRGYNNRVLPLGQQRGGLVYNKFVFELRYPVSLNPSATIFLLTFMEGGNAWDNYKEFNPFKLYRSAGVGARIFMPAFGLIGIDYGIPFDKNPLNPNDKNFQQSFQFTIGQQIR